MRLPRLQQPLFSKEYGEAYRHALDDKLLARIVMAYDCIWSQLYEPSDISAADIQAKAEGSLQNLGSIIEHAIGESVFDVCPEQLSFDETILNPSI